MTERRASNNDVNGNNRLTKKLNNTGNKYLEWKKIQEEEKISLKEIMKQEKRTKEEYLTKEVI